MHFSFLGGTTSAATKFWLQRPDILDEQGIVFMETR